MPHAFPAWLDNVQGLLPAVCVVALLPLAAAVCGGVIGIERQRREKPAGSRTLMLVALGACVFTQLGRLIGGDAEARITAQIVTGIGFLGAGAIIHSSGKVVGVTTGAAVWATAAIGVVIGAGYPLLGFFYTLLAVLTLSAERLLRRAIYGPRRPAAATVVFSWDSGKSWPIVSQVLEDHEIPPAQVRLQRDGDEATLRIEYDERRPDQRDALVALAGLGVVRSIEAGSTD